MKAVYYDSFETAISSYMIYDGNIPTILPSSTTCHLRYISPYAFTNGPRICVENLF